MFNPKDGYISFIINPKSGASSHKLMISRFRNYLYERRFDLRVNFTKSLAHACELATTEAENNECMLIAVAGGDGTVREVAHGLVGKKAPLLIIPSGTENLLANELGFRTTAGTIIDAFESGIIKPLDVGRVNDRFFTTVSGCGFDAEVVKRMSEIRKGHINQLDYFWPLWRTFWSHQFPRFRVVVDGREIFDGQGMVFVGNISRYAIGLEILKNADYGDGLLDVCIYRCGGRIKLLEHALMTTLKRHTKHSNVVYCQGRTVSIGVSGTGRDEVLCEIDGDPGPDLPVRIEIIPQAVKVLVPSNARPAGIRTRLRRVIG